MYPPKKHIKQMFSEREIKIMQKAKAYGIGSLSNEILARELFSLSFHVDLDKKTALELIKFYDNCDEAISKAQMSS
jgi:hypothetical protein